MHDLAPAVPAQSPPAPARLPPLMPWVAAVLIVGLAIGPFVCMRGDMFNSWLKWAAATAGRRPWAAYGPRLDCNYPPLVPYWLTGVAAAVRAAGASPVGKLAVELVKLPNLLAWAAGAVLCDRGLRAPFGPRPARAAALAYALCLPLGFNAAVWGQWEAIVSLAAVGAIVALLNGRPTWAAVAVGLGLAAKLQAIVIVPAVAVYAWRRFGPATAIRSAAVAAAVILAAAIPHAAGGAGRSVAKAYTGAAGYYDALSVDAYNGWELLYLYRTHVRHEHPRLARIDSRPLAGPITPKRVGLAAFAAYTGWVLLGLYRRPTADGLAWAVGLTALAFYVLPTEVHERYGVPAAAVLAVVVARPGGRGPFLAVSAVMLVNQAVALLVQEVIYTQHATGPKLAATAEAIAVVGSLASLATFVWASARYHAVVRGTAAAAAVTNHRQSDVALAAVDA